MQLRAQWLATEDLDASLVTRWRTTDYLADYGVTDEQTGEGTIETRYQLSPALAAHAFASLELRRRRMVTIASQPGPLGGGVGAGSSAFPLANRWAQSSRATTVAVGSGLEWRPFAPMTLEADYQYLRTQELVDTSFDRTGNAPAVVLPATARSKFPELQTTDHVLELSARYAWTDAVDTALAYRLIRSEIDDYHQSGLVPLVNQNLYLAGIDDDFTAHLIGVTTRLRF